MSRSYAPNVVLAFALRQGLALLVGAPLALCGLLVHFVPFQLTDLLVRKLHRTDEEEATDKIIAGLVVFPLAWALEAFCAFRLGGAWALAVFLLALLPTAFCALSWRERFRHVRQEATGLWRLVFERDLLARLRREREAIARELLELGRA